MDLKVNRRQVIKRGFGGLAALSMGGLAGCDASAQSAAAQGAIGLQMFFWGSATRDQLTRKTIDLFHQGHQQITIGSQYSGNDTYYTKLDDKITKGQTPDLIQMDMRYISGYVRKGILLDITGYIYNQAIDLSDFDPLQIISSKVNNGIYGVSLGSNYQCLFYDQTQLELAGLGAVPTHMSWQDFANYTAEVTQALNNGTYGSSDGSGNYDAFEIWIRQRNKELYTRNGQLGFDQTDIAEWYDYWNGMRKSNSCPPMGIQAKLDLTGTPTDSSVIHGNAVFSHIFTNQYVAFQSATTHTLALAAYPQGAFPGMYLKASQLLSIAAATKYPDSAASFASFFINDPGAVKVLGMERGVPGSAHALSLLKPQFTAPQQVIVEFMNHIATTNDSRIKEILEPPAAGKIATILQQYALAIGNGQQSVSNGASAFYKDAQKATQA